MPIVLTGSVGLRGKNHPDDVLAVKTRLIDLGMTWIAQGIHVGPVTINAIRLFQGMKNGVNRLAAPGNDGRVDPDGDTLAWLNAANAPAWRLMTAGGLGFVNDERRNPDDNHDYGSSWLDDTIVATGAAYAHGFLADQPDLVRTQRFAPVWSCRSTSAVSRVGA